MHWIWRLLQFVEVLFVTFLRLIVFVFRWLKRSNIKYMTQVIKILQVIFLLTRVKQMAVTVMCSMSLQLAT